jgi:hypothetical protein
MVLAQTTTPKKKKKKKKRLHKEVIVMCDTFNLIFYTTPNQYTWPYEKLVITTRFFLKVGESQTSPKVKT